MAKQKILVCEDEEDARNSIRNILIRRDYDVRLALDGQESIERAREFKPDLILLDIRMPKIDGIGVAKQIRSFDSQVKIIFITSFQSPELVKEATKYNICDYILKPCTHEDIVNAVQDAFQNPKVL